MSEELKLIIGMALALFGPGLVDAAFDYAERADKQAVNTQIEGERLWAQK